MSEEVKLILDKLNEDKDYDDYVDYKGSYFKPLLNYITNLQEKLEDKLTSDELVSMLNQELVRQNQDYKQRNEKAIEFIEHENFKRNILVGVSTKKYTRDILNNVLNILKGDKDE